MRSAVKLEFVWDDHDYNQNNGFGDNPVKGMMLELFRQELNLTLRFEDSLHQEIDLADGIKLILLDVRSHRTVDHTISDQDFQWLEEIF